MCNEAYATLYVDSIEFYIRDFRAEIVIFLFDTGQQTTFLNGAVKQ